MTGSSRPSDRIGLAGLKTQGGSSSTANSSSFTADTTVLRVSSKVSTGWGCGLRRSRNRRFLSLAWAATRRFTWVWVSLRSRRRTSHWKASNRIFATAAEGPRAGISKGLARQWKVRWGHQSQKEPWNPGALRIFRQSQSPCSSPCEVSLLSKLSLQVK